MSTISLIFSFSSVVFSVFVFKGVFGNVIISFFVYFRISNGSINFKKVEIRVGFVDNFIIQFVSLMSTIRFLKLLVKLVISFKCSCFNFNILLAGKLVGWNCFFLILVINFWELVVLVLVEVWWCNSRFSKYLVFNREILVIISFFLMILELVQFRTAQTGIKFSICLRVCSITLFCFCKIMVILFRFLISVLYTINESMLKFLVVNVFEILDKISGSFCIKQFKICCFFG